jgi:DNA-binding response OmpR family regulator
MYTALLIEDDPMQAKIQSHMLTAAGFEVTHCENGCKGIGRALKSRFDVIVTDIDLPDIQGDSIAKILSSYYNGTVPIYMLSANQEHFKVGIDDHGIACRMQKPFNKTMAAMIKTQVSKRI